MRTNYHTHCHFDDGSGDPEDYIREALRQNFSALGFSCHAPLPFPNGWAMTEAALEEYRQRVEGLKKAYGGQIEIYRGLEVDYLPGLMGPGTPRIRDQAPDYILASVHMIRDPSTGNYLGIDGPVEEYKRLINGTFGGNIRAMVGEYFRLQTRLVEEEDFDILGHCDLVQKHNRGCVFFDSREDWYQEAAAGLLEAAARRGVIIEVNTGAMARGYADRFYPDPAMLARIGSLGGGVALNSDAHHPANLSFAFSSSLPIIKEAGFSSLRVLLGGSWQDAPLDGDY
jgi:histidinol-phosphatase (PHP family)